MKGVSTWRQQKENHDKSVYLSSNYYTGDRICQKTGLACQFTSELSPPARVNHTVKLDGRKQPGHPAGDLWFVKFASRFSSPQASWRQDREARMGCEEKLWKQWAPALRQLTGTVPAAGRARQWPLTSFALWAASEFALFLPYNLTV